ncbi:MAG: LacI family DNA-binding transcriptional regulator [Ruthenibacterium lactatiformans]
MASTIKDVARLAGVSISTVSRVANNASNVSPPIRKKVLRAIKALNYTPNIVARSLEARSLKNIAVVMGRTMDQAFLIQIFRYPAGHHIHAGQARVQYSFTYGSKTIDGVGTLH